MPFNVQVAKAGWQEKCGPREIAGTRYADPRHACCEDSKPMVGVSRQHENAILKIFQKAKVAIGVVHCLPLPGSPRYDGGSVEAIYDRSLQDAEAYVAGGIDGLII